MALTNLGQAVQIIRGGPNSVKSTDFFMQLGFRKLREGDTPFGTKFALLTDGVVNLLLSDDKLTYTGLIYFDMDQHTRVKKLEELGITFFWKSPAEMEQFNAMFEIVPELFAVNLVEDDYDSDLIPSGKSEVEFGRFGELAIPVKDYLEVKEILAKVGFREAFHSEKPYPWGIFMDDLMVIGVHQTSDFSVPTLTYFHEHMDKILPLLQKKGIELHPFSGGDISSGNALVIAPNGQNVLLVKGKV